MKEVFEIPNDAKLTMVRALNLYQKFLAQAIEMDSQANEIAYENFDVRGLLGIFKDENIQVEIRIDRKLREGFSFPHGVDFPEWD